MREEGVPLAPVAIPALVSLVVLELLLFGLSSGPRAYGHMSDEFYYLDCASRLAWGYVDHPPLSIAVLALVKGVFGTSLLALRLVPALVACVNLVLVGLLARELGGGRGAQSLAALAAATAPVYLAFIGFYSMNSFEPAFWSGAMLLMARIVNDEAPSDWLILGVVLGLGLLNKVSVLWLGLGLGVGLVLTPQRRWLATPWPWVCGALALAIFSPHLFWQEENGWPTLEFMQRARDIKMVVRTPLEFLGGQLTIWLGTAPLWIAGLGFYFGKAGSEHRWLGWTWLSVMALLMSSGTARASYSAPAFAALLAGGGVALESMATGGWRRIVPASSLVLMLLVGGLSAPLAIPLLPPAELAKYAERVGIQPGEDEQEASGQLPLHFALRFGWKEVADAVAEASASLSPGERLHAVVLGRSFGVTGAINHYGRHHRRLPPAVSGHNNYWLWGPGETDGDVVIAVAEDAKELELAYRSVVHVADVDCEYCRPEIDRYRVFVGRGLRRPLEDLWRELKRFE